MWGHPLHASSFDPQFLTEHRKVGFQLIDSRVFRIPVGDQRLAPSEHGNSHDADNIQHCTSDARVPILGEPQRLNIFFTDFGQPVATLLTPGNLRQNEAKQRHARTFRSCAFLSFVIASGRNTR